MRKTPPLKLEKDFIDFIELCNTHEVKYLVIGGYAVSIHGYPRSTKDLDVCIKVSEDNAEKMVAVMVDFGFGSLQLEKKDFLRNDFITQLGHEPVRIDVLNDLNGVDFDIAWQNRKEITYEGVPINFIGYNELLKVKAHAGRPQDIADITKLKARNKE
jgi:predicted nucleotidyltransferase